MKQVETNFITKVTGYETRTIYRYGWLIYAGELLIPGADEFIHDLHDLLTNNMRFSFMTNNSQRISLEVVKKVRKLGLEITEKHVYTSATGTGKFLSDHPPSGYAFVLGEGFLLTSLHESGLH